MVNFARLIYENLHSSDVKVRFAWDIKDPSFYEKSKELVADFNVRYMKPVVYAIHGNGVVAVAYRSTGDMSKEYNYKAVIGVSDAFKGMEDMYKKMISYMLVEYMRIKENAPWWYSIRVVSDDNHVLSSCLIELRFKKKFRGEYEWNWSMEESEDMKMVKHRPIATKRNDDDRFKDKHYNKSRARQFILKHLISIGKGSEKYPPNFNIENISKGKDHITLTYSYIDSASHRRTGGMHYGFQGNIIQKLPTGVKDQITIKLDDW